MWISVILLPVVFIVGIFVYNKVLLPKMNEKSEAKQQALTENFISQVRGRENELRSHYAKTNDAVSPIAKKMNEERVEGIISCMERRGLKDVAKQAAINAAGKAVGKIVGFGFKQEDNEEDYYLALAPERLHYLHFAENGICKEHLSFDRNRIENLEAGRPTSAEALTISGDVFTTSRLSFMYNGEAYKFFYFDKFYAPSAEDDVDDKGFAELNYLFAEPFLKFAEDIRQDR